MPRKAPALHATGREGSSIDKGGGPTPPLRRAQARRHGAGPRVPVPETPQQREQGGLSASLQMCSEHAPVKNPAMVESRHGFSSAPDPRSQRTLPSSLIRRGQGSLVRGATHIEAVIDANDDAAIIELPFEGALNGNTGSNGDGAKHSTYPPDLIKEDSRTKFTECKQKRLHTLRIRYFLTVS